MRVLFILTAWLVAGVCAQAETCNDSALDFFRSVKKLEIVYICRNNSEKKVCDYKKPGFKCELLDLSKTKSRLEKEISSANGYAARKALTRFRTSKSWQRTALVGYLALMDWSGPIRVRPRFQIQTGHYEVINIADRPFNAKCFDEILESAYLISEHFAEFNFSIDSNITQCKRLIQGVHHLVTHKEKVANNLLRFHSPMHTIFLTNETKFNHYVLGKMGLYVNVDRQNEIDKRLIKFQVGVDHITHETRSGEQDALNL